MRLYGNTFGPGPRRVSLCLSMKGIEGVEFIKMPAYGGRSPEFMKKSPGAKIPLLELDDGTCLFESQAIVQYLEETYPDATRVDDEALRQKVDIQCHLINEYFHCMYVSTLRGAPVASRLFEPVPEADALARRYLRARLRQIEEVMGADRYLAGARPTLADLMLFSVVEYTRMRFGIFLPPAMTGLIEWYARYSQQPGIFANGHQDDEEFWEKRV